MRKITRLLACMVAVMALTAGPAFAQTTEAYNGLAGAQQGGGGGAGEAQAAETGGSLPFTGLEIALVATAGLGLLAVGFAVRRASGPRESTP
jgi:hypothetical protein